MRKMGGLLLGLMMFAGVLLLPAVSHAIPAFARKYGSSCTLCHYPAVPRLNTFGHQFRRAGYRMPDEINEAQDITKVGNFIALRARPRFDARIREGQRDDFEFQLNDVTFFYAGALHKNFSAFTETEIEGDSGDIELLGQIGGIYGEWGNFATFRVGQMHTLQRVGFGGLDRPTGLTTHALADRVLTAGGVPFRLAEDQRGLELTYVYGRSRVIGQVLNGINSEGDGTGDGFDRDTAKDFLFAYEYLLDDIASGFTVFTYKGTFHAIDEPEPRQRLDFIRAGATANKVFDLGPTNFEIMGGYVRSEDFLPDAVGPNVSGNAFFVELEQVMKELNFLTLLGRFDYVNPSLGRSDDVLMIGTVGVVSPIQEYLRLALEGQIFDNDAQGTTDYRVRAELMVNF